MATTGLEGLTVGLEYKTAGKGCITARLNYRSPGVGYKTAGQECITARLNYISPGVKYKTAGHGYITAAGNGKVVNWWQE